ncbi:serine/threonine protein kinase [Streptosporangium sp. NPDC002607]
MGDLHPLLQEDPKRIGVHLLVGRLVEDPTQAVYLGHLLDEDTLRVIRVLEACPGTDPPTRERITNELHAARRVSGAHAARLLEVGWFDDSPYVVREHLGGRSLRETVTTDGPLSGDALERLAVSMLTSLTAIHLSGLVHGGLSPDTVLLGPDGPRVCDIGLGDTGSEPGYRAPEYIHPAFGSGGDIARITETGTGQAPVPATVAGRPADLFAWAATVVYAATGQPPLLERPETAPEGPANLTGIPSGLRSLIAVCLDSRPEARPDTGAAMLRLLGEQPVETLLPAPPPPAEGGGNIPGAKDGALYPASVQPPATPLWNAPPLPGSPPPMSGTVITEPAREQRKTAGFPLMLVTGVGVVALMSGLGIWAAGNYASLGNTGQVAAANERAPLALASQWQGQGGGDPGRGSAGPGGAGGDPGQSNVDPGQGTTDDPANRVTVPWGMTPEPRVGDVGPLQLPTDVPTPPALDPLTPPPTAVPTIPAAPLPTAAPTAAPAPPPQATEKARATPTARAGERQKPTPRTTEPQQTSQPKPSPTRETPEPPPPAPTRSEQSPTREAPEPPPPTQSKPPSSKPTTNPPAVAPESPPTTKPPAAKPTTAKPTTAAPKPTAAPAPRSNPYSPQQVCGSGYYVQRSAQFGGGTTYQLYNTSTGTNCAVTMKTADVGKATQVWATLEVQGGGSKTDRGNFEYYAGPVFLPAKGKCVRISGGGPGGSTGTGWANCG